MRTANPSQLAVSWTTLLLLLGSACSGDDAGPVEQPMDAAIDASEAGIGGGGRGGGGSGGSSSGGQGGGSVDEDGGSADGSVDGGATDGGPVVLPPPADCKRFGDDCAGSGECCSGLCDPATDSCSSSVENCAGDGDACGAATDCCDLRCDGTCQGGACVSDGEECEEDLDCCGQSCVGGLCAALNLSCKTAGNACSGSGECCSGLCDDDKCVLSASFCIQEGDLCARAEDCCTGTCVIADGLEVGLCGPPPTGASFCNDGVEGSICGDCNECCSRLCAPYGPTGVNVCQPASGCHVTGDFCRKDGDCCGAEGTGLPGEGNVFCEKGEGADLGICRNPMSCSPQGNVCHFKDYACGVSSARANCCGGLGANGGVCQLDGLGVPRCNGLGDECIEAGEICASADDCCDDVPCVPDDEGVLRCFDPPGDDPPCVPVTGSCTVNADCCVGGTCIRPVGSTEGSCQGTTGGSGGSGGGGSGGSDSPPCATYGQSCDEDGDCCNDVPCTDGVCRVEIG
jgi:hypothetical protein